jgi:coenzyme F420 biosynthesis associated uncharacterized protein
MIDWVLAERLAAWLAGRGDAPAPASIAKLAATAQDAEERVVRYTGLTPSRPLPAPEAIARREWIHANVATMSRMLDPVLERAQDRLSAKRKSAVTRARGMAPAAMSLTVSVAVTTELAVVLGFLAQRVLGQYELVLLDDGDSPSEPRLLFVLPNLGSAVAALDVPEDEFLTWVTLHEVTHAVQFSGVPWLQGYLGGLLSQLLGSAELRMDAPRGRRLPSRAQLARSLRAAREGDVVGIFASPVERETLDRVQAAMAVVEGHAEHVMDAVAPELLPSLPRLRASLDRRRKTQKGLSRVLGKLLGMEMKMRQYEQGKFFCDAIVEAAGTEALVRVFSSPEALPTLDELDAPGRWIARMGLDAQLSSAASDRSL